MHPYSPPRPAPRQGQSTGKTPEHDTDGAPGDDGSVSTPIAAGTDAAGRAALARLLKVLRLEPMAPAPGLIPDRAHFRGESIPVPLPRIYGGQVLAQALLAAGHTVDPERPPHSMHGYFLRAGDPNEPIDFSVEVMRDGRSFSARRTHAIQFGVPILSMIASFQQVQPGIEYAPQMPDAPDPDAVPTSVIGFGRSAQTLPAEQVGRAGRDGYGEAKTFEDHLAFELRPVGQSVLTEPDPDRADHQMVWLRARAPLPTDPLLHRSLMAFACDRVILEPVLRATGQSWASPKSAASLDHAMWWHRDARADEWLLYVQRASSAQGARGLATAQVFTQDGTLAATIAQEGTFRI